MTKLERARIRLSCKRVVDKGISAVLSTGIYNDLTFPEELYEEGNELELLATIFGIIASALDFGAEVIREGKDNVPMDLAEALLQRNTEEFSDYLHGRVHKPNKEQEGS